MAAIQRGSSSAVPSSGGTSSPLDDAPAGFKARTPTADAVYTGMVAVPRSEPVATSPQMSAPPPALAGSVTGGGVALDSIPREFDLGSYEIQITSGGGGAQPTAPKAPGVVAAAPVASGNAWLILGGLVVVGMLLGRGKQ